MAEKKTETPTKASGSKKRVLIVEDERPLAHALELKFSHEGYETKVCSNGAEGLKMAGETSFDVILLDLIMPEMDGFTFLGEIAKTKKKTPIIVLTNLGQEEDRKRAEALGAKGYFVKSNTPIAQIVEHVRSIL
jgi:DNA-binding response OmpR family regulator